MRRHRRRARARRARRALLDLDQPGFVHAKYGGIVRRLPRAATCRFCRLPVEGALDQAGATFATVDGIARDSRPRAHRKPRRRRRRCQGARLRARQAALRRQPPARHMFAPFSTRAGGAAVSLPRSSSPEATRSSSPSIRLRRCVSSAARATMPPAKRTTGPRGCSVSPIPVGAALDRFAASRESTAYTFPRHKPPPGAFDLSFSGLKTSVRYFLESPAGARHDARTSGLFSSGGRRHADGPAHGRIPSAPYRARRAFRRRRREFRASAAVQEWSARHNVDTFVPPAKYCTDNAAMIAAAAFHQRDATRADPLTLSADPDLPFAFEAV